MVGEKPDPGKIAQFTKSLICGGLSAALSLTAQPAWTQSRGISSTGAASPVITVATPSQAGLTVPSLWWAKEQFGGNLLDSWIIYPKQGNSPNHVDLLIRPEIWNRLNYLERYAFVNRFGSVASDYGYNLRALDSQSNLLATYTCNFSRANPDYLKGVRDARGQRVPNYVSPVTAPSGRQNSDGLTCQVGLKPFGFVKLQSRPSIQSPGFPAPEFPATESGTGQP